MEENPKAGHPKGAGSPETRSDLIAGLEAAMRQMSHIERKVDRLIEERSRKARAPRHFSGGRDRPSRERDFNRESRSSGDSSFSAEPRPRRNDETRRRKFKPFDREPGEPPPEEIGIFIRKKPHGEHFTNRKKPEQDPG